MGRVVAWLYARPLPCPAQVFLGIDRRMSSECSDVRWSLSFIRGLQGGTKRVWQYNKYTTECSCDVMWLFTSKFTVSYLVSWCFKPSQSQRIISGLRKTFMKSYIIQRTNEAEIRPENKSEKAESCRENLWNEL